MARPLGRLTHLALSAALTDVDAAVAQMGQLLNSEGVATLMVELRRERPDALHLAEQLAQLRRTLKKTEGSIDVLLRALGVDQPTIH